MKSSIYNWLWLLVCVGWGWYGLWELVEDNVSSLQTSKPVMLEYGNVISYKGHFINIDKVSDYSKTRCFLVYSTPDNVLINIEQTSCTNNEGN